MQLGPFFFEIVIARFSDCWMQEAIGVKECDKTDECPLKCKIDIYNGKKFPTFRISAKINYSLPLPATLCSLPFARYPLLGFHVSDSLVTVDSGLISCIGHISEFT